MKKISPKATESAPKLSESSFSPTMALLPGTSDIITAHVAEEFNEPFGDLSNIEEKLGESPGVEKEEITEVHLFGVRRESKPDLHERIEKEVTAEKIKTQGSHRKIPNDPIKRVKEMMAENDDSQLRDSIMTGEMNMSQINRVIRQGLFLVEEYFLIGIGSHFRKALSNHPSNSTIKYQLGGIFHQPGKRFRSYHLNLLADNDLMYDGMTFMTEIKLTNENIAK